MGEWKLQLALELGIEKLEMIDPFLCLTLRIAHWRLETAHCWSAANVLVVVVVAFGGAIELEIAC